MNKTKIEWVKNPDGTQGDTWNPITGCLNGCPYCYARKLANGRLKSRYVANTNIAPVYAECGEEYHKADRLIAEADPFYPRFWEERIGELDTWSYDSKPHGVFVCDMGDLFGRGVPEEWTRRVLGAIDEQLMRPHKDRFYLLTKQPQNLQKWSPFPDNCWVGVTATDQDMVERAIPYLACVQARVKFLSLEPLLGPIDLLPFIGYHKPIENEEANESETERGNSLSGCGTGRVRSRPAGSYLEGQEPHGTEDRRGQDLTLREAASGEQHREVSPSKSYGQLEADSVLSPPSRMASLIRTDTRGIVNESQERRQEGQSARESRVGHILGQHPAYVGCTKGGSRVKPAGPEQCHGEVDTRSREGDSSAGRPDNSRGQTSKQPQSSGFGREVWSHARPDLGCDLRANLDLSLVIIGQQTPVRTSTMPKVEWIREIVDAADKAGVPVFLKNNLFDLLDSDGPEVDFAFGMSDQLRQEFPAGKE